MIQRYREYYLLPLVRLQSHNFFVRARVVTLQHRGPHERDEVGVRSLRLRPPPEAVVPQQRALLLVLRGPLAPRLAERHRSALRAQRGPAAVDDANDNCMSHSEKTTPGWVTTRKLQQIRRTGSL